MEFSQLVVAVNNGNNGAFMGKIQGMAVIMEDDSELNLVAWEEYSFEYRKPKIAIIDDQRLQYSSIKIWRGSWACDLLFVDSLKLRRFLNQLDKSKWAEESATDGFQWGQSRDPGQTTLGVTGQSERPEHC